MKCTLYRIFTTFRLASIFSRYQVKTEECMQIFTLIDFNTRQILGKRFPYALKSHRKTFSGGDIDLPGKIYMERFFVFTNRVNNDQF